MRIDGLPIHDRLAFISPIIRRQVPVELSPEDARSGDAAPRREVLRILARGPREALQRSVSDGVGGGVSATGGPPRYPTQSPCDGFTCGPGRLDKSRELLHPSGGTEHSGVPTPHRKRILLRQFPELLTFDAGAEFMLSVSNVEADQRE